MHYDNTTYSLVAGGTNELIFSRETHLGGGDEPGSTPALLEILIQIHDDSIDPILYTPYDWCENEC